ncbi:hypothetical protein PGB90_005233 [Kerria lacca]
MIFEKNRLETFTQWIYKDDNKAKCTPEKMAKAGFYVVSENEPGTVKCFVCLKTLDGWERDDDPIGEHIKHAPQCPFIKLNKKESDLTLNEIISLCENMEINILEQKLQEYCRKFNEMQDKMINQLRNSEKKKKN